MNRRQLAGASAAALLVGLAGAGKAAELDGELLARVDGLVAHLAWQRVKDAAMTEEERGAAYAQLHRASRCGAASQTEILAAEIARIPARTPEGTQAKARAMVWLYGGDDTRQVGIVHGDGLLESMLADLTGIPTVLRPFPAVVERPEWADPDAELRRHLATYKALGLQANAIVAASRSDSTSEADGRTLTAVWDEQDAAVDAMVAAGCRTYEGRIALAVALAQVGHRGPPDPHGDSPDDRVAALLTRSFLATVAGRAA